MSDKHPLTKKEKQRKKNKRDWIIFTQVKEQLSKVDIGAPEIEKDAAPPPKPEANGEPGFEVKVKNAMGRNQMRRSQAKDRWNRFAGTSSSSGARGR